MVRPVFCLLCCLAVAAPATGADARTRRTGVDFAGKRAEAVQGKVLPRQTFDAPMNGQFVGKTFEMKSWKKHFSPWGRRRAAIAGSGDERKVFKTDTVEFPEKEFELARWNGKLADLEREARIKTGDDAGMATDSPALGFHAKRTYDSQMEQAGRLSEMGEDLSLRDINRYNFRRNRPEGGIPAAAAGVGDVDG